MHAACTLDHPSSILGLKDPSHPLQNLQVHGATVYQRFGLLPRFTVRLLIIWLTLCSYAVDKTNEGCLRCV